MTAHFTIQGGRERWRGGGGAARHSQQNPTGLKGWRKLCGPCRPSYLRKSASLRWQRACLPSALPAGEAACGLQALPAYSVICPAAARAPLLLLSCPAVPALPPLRVCAAGRLSAWLPAASPPRLRPAAALSNPSRRRCTRLPRRARSRRRSSAPMRAACRVARARARRRRSGAPARSCPSPPSLHPTTRQSGRRSRRRQSLTTRCLSCRPTTQMRHVWWAGLWRA